MKPTLNVGDLFCGAGGSSHGVLAAAKALGHKVQLTGINHWDVAVATHELNLPGGRHLHSELDDVEPLTLYKQGGLDFLWASPECTHHSNARGGKPCSNQSRSTAFRVVNWATALLPDVIMVENVPEFQTWGPLIRVRALDKKTGKQQWLMRPDPERKGETYRKWLNAFRRLGYTVEARVLCAADYGDPTSRRRLFVQAVRNGRKIVWPEPTHAAGPEPESGLKPYVTAREIIDWDIPSTSIFKRKRPLSPNTIRRIEIGLEKYGLTPFIVPQQRQGRQVKSVDEPVSVVTTTTRGEGLAEPFIVKLQNHGDAESIDTPVGSIRAQGTHYALAQPYLVQVAHQGSDESRAKSLSDPLPTVCGSRGEFALIRPFVVSIDQSGSHSGAVKDVGDPLSTVVTKQRHCLVEPYLVTYNGKSTASSVDKPVPTVVGKPHHYLAQPYLIKFYGTANAASLDEPLHTVTAKARHALAQPVLRLEDGDYLLDIHFRMLQPNELAAAQGFPKDYQFTGNKTETVKQIGNAVPCHTACALTLAALSQQSDVSKLMEKAKESLDVVAA